MTWGDIIELRVVLIKKFKTKIFHRLLIESTAMAGVLVDQTKGEWCDLGF